MESTVSRLSKGAKYPSFTAAEIASSTRWLRGMKAGLAARIAARSSFASPPSSASRWRHLAAQSSKELGSVNRLRPTAAPAAPPRAAGLLPPPPPQQKPMAPSRRPIVEGARIGKQAAHTRVAVGAGSRVAQPAEDQGEIGAVVGHALEKVLC